MSARAATAIATLVGFVGVLVLPTASDAAPRNNAPVVVAHRGASGYAPENTLQAIDNADKLGFDWVENDVQRTKDGRLVVIHDTNLARTTNVEQVFPGRAPYNVRDFTAAEIAKLDAGRWKGAKFKGSRVPTLTQYLDRVDHNHQKLLMEVKNPELYPGIETDILRVLGKEGWLNRDHIRNRLVIQSFSANSVRTVHALRPDITTGFLGTPAVSDLPRYARFADRIHPSYGTISQRYVASAHAIKGPHGKRLQLFTWTVNDAATARRMAGLGVDGIISNFPDVVRKAVGGGQ
ncbi:glycerophosphodiester phosphodiesterase [Streptomyces sp. NBC_00145]|uniref:glycerophosphodiester phosphodiesterase n=1 Tax=Streptomyces sp. NBC_00145 TaxID=2975666 RepID=UPI003FA6CDE7